MQQSRLTQGGAYLVHRLMRMFVYYDAVVIDTPILSDDARPLIGDVRLIAERLDRADIFLDYLDEQFRGFGTLDTGLDWPEMHAAAKEDVQQVRQRLARGSSVRRSEGSRRR